jgi:hypothetical protein
MTADADRALRHSGAKCVPLLPCPFCGSADLREESTACSEIAGKCFQSGWIECKACEVYGPSIEMIDSVPPYDAVREAWNKRAAPPCECEAERLLARARKYLEIAHNKHGVKFTDFYPEIFSEFDAYLARSKP